MARFPWAGRGARPRPAAAPPFRGSCGTPAVVAATALPDLAYKTCSCPGPSSPYASAGMQTPPSRNSLAPELSCLDGAESPLMLIHWVYGDTAHYYGWLLPHSLRPPCAFYGLGEFFARSNSHESPELSEFGANVYAYAVTACPCRVRPLCQFSEMWYVPLDSAVTSRPLPKCQKATLRSTARMT